MRYKDAADAFVNWNVERQQREDAANAARDIILLDKANVNEVRVAANGGVWCSLGDIDINDDGIIVEEKI